MLRAQEDGYIQRTSLKRLKAARLVNPQATLVAVWENPPLEITPQRLALLTSSDWIVGPSPSNLVIIGPTGSGKSFHVQAIGHEVCMNLRSVRYCRLAELAAKIEEVLQDITATNALAK